MPEIKNRTKGNSNPRGKRRVYFTCHPADFDRYFDKLCQDIFKTHDVAIYYTADMQAPFSEEELDTDLGSNNLFIVPVTFRLLREPNRAMDRDLAYAKANHIPILPFMMESGIDFFYAQPEKFGDRQYLSPYSDDSTALPYEQKLKKYLDTLLVSDKTVRQIQAAFDAYIFLSYRKKDRRYANELMGLIHENPEYQDIAIWYDEFLIPGESFRENIERFLGSSRFMALVVTGNLLEEPGGKPNFVMDTEYPMACRNGKSILPMEMAATDRRQLSEKYPDIPPCLDPRDKAALLRSLEQVLSRSAKEAPGRDPMHTFLIGLAYLEGIDVEVNRKRGIALVTEAARAELPEAMEKLFDMYRSGSHVSLDYREAALWGENLAAWRREHLGPNHPDTLNALNNLACTYSDLGRYQEALELNQKVYALRCKVLGKEHPDALASLTNLANTYNDLGQYQEAFALGEKVCALYFRVLGEAHPNALPSLHNLARTYNDLGRHQEALDLGEKVYALHCKVLGEEHPDTLKSLLNLANSYSNLGRHQEALALDKKAYALHCKVLGEEHPDTLSSLHNLAITYSDLGRHQEALELKKMVYSLRCRMLGEAHPDTITSLHSLARSYSKLGLHQEALKLDKKVYALYCTVLGKEHPNTITSLNNLASSYSKLGMHQEASEALKQVYSLYCNVLGKDHPDTLNALFKLLASYTA